MKREARAVLFLLTLLLLAVWLLSLSGRCGVPHECHGERCPLCLLDSLREELLRCVALILVAALVVLFAARIFSFRKSPAFSHPSTPVFLKVKLLN